MFFFNRFVLAEIYIYILRPLDPSLKMKTVAWFALGEWIHLIVNNNLK